MGERLTLQVLEHKKVDTALGADVVKNADVGMVQAGDGARFTLEALAAHGIAGEMRRQNLDGHGAVKAGVPGAINLAHPARAQRREDFVRPEFRP